MWTETREGQHSHLSPHDRSARAPAHPAPMGELLVYAALEDTVSAVEAERRRLAGSLQRSVVEPLNLLLSQANTYEQSLRNEQRLELLIKICELMAEQPMPEPERVELRKLAEEESRVVIRIKPEATFESPPRHVYTPDDVETLSHGYGASIPWGAD